MNYLLQKNYKVIVPQFLNCIEAFMIYCWHEGITADSREYFDKITVLFEKHQKVREKIKKMLEGKKKKSDKRMTIASNTKMEMINSTCVWDRKECSHSLKIIVEDDDNAATTAALKADREFIKFVWRATNEKIENMQKALGHRNS
jgi:hypothetical protein